MNNLRVVFDKVDSLLSLSDSEEQDECRVVITYPDGTVQDLGKILKASNDWSYSLASRTDSDGNYLEGTYSFLFERYDVGGTVPTITDTGSFELAVTARVPDVTETKDVFTPLLRLTDDTDYDDIDGVWTIDTVSRAWNASNETHYYGPGVQQSLTLYDAGYFTGDYEYTFRYVAAYHHDNGWISTRLEADVNGSFTINNPVMLPELAALFTCLWTKILAKDCCKDAAYDLMVADYQLAVAMSHHFILNGQAGVTGTIQNNLLFGSDCNPGILGLLKRWGCEDATIEETLLSTYDWCLCETEGGGGGSFEQEGYDAGNGCWLVSDAIDDDDRWTFAKSSGIGTFTQNLAGSKIFGGNVTGTAGDATYTANLATQSFRLEIPVPGENANTGYANLLMANVDVFASHPADPTPAAPYTKRYGDVDVRLEDISDGKISFAFAGIGATLSGGWTIVFKLPY